jgi:hypothetical protein
VALFIQPAFAADSRNVVRAKAASPSGAGSAMPGTDMTSTDVGLVVVSSLTVK